MKTAFKICASAIGLLLAMATASLGGDAEPPTTLAAPDQHAAETPSPTPMGCCRVCSKGKACGNSCISRADSCHQPPGCACDG
jgi:hypothetical protein